jgi:hypothetical protein
MLQFVSPGVNPSGLQVYRLKTMNRFKSDSEKEMDEISALITEDAALIRSIEKASKYAAECVVNKMPIEYGLFSIYIDERGQSESVSQDKPQ